MQDATPISIRGGWERIEPLLDDAMQAMNETDRAAILLRFFQQKRLREVGLALGWRRKRRANAWTGRWRNCAIGLRRAASRIPPLPSPRALRAGCASRAGIVAAT
jgi:hypothetical protein